MSGRAEAGKSALETIAHYRLASPVSESGLVATYRATDLSTGRAVFVKASAPKVAPTPRVDEGLLAEAQLLARVRHAHVIVLYEVVREGARVALALEDPGGPSLEAALDRLEPNGGFSPEQALAVTLALTQAVAEVHALGIVHGGVTPRSVFLSKVRGLVLSGFERAREGKREAEVERGAVDAHYLSPEEVQGESATAASDVFSLGALAYRMIAGNEAFEREVSGRSRGDRPPAMDPSRRISFDVERAITRALSRQSAPRQADAGELLGDLTAALGSGFPKADHLAALHARASSDDVLEQRGRGTPLPVESPPAMGSSLGARLAVIGGLMCAIAIGAEAIERSSSREPTSLGPSSAPGFVKILAHPWAEIYVDGNYADTTPIGKPMQLRAGRHTVLFKHPSASDERRVIDVQPNTTLTLDVELHVIAPPVDAGVDASP